jgi:phosphoesterase RecJ-like protein
MDFQKAVGLIKKSKRVLITTHIKPDGDACGCMAAIREALTALGKNVKILLLSELPSWYEFLFEQKPEISTYDILHTIYEPDLIVIVDTSSYNQLPGLDKYLKMVIGNSKLVTGNYHLPFTIHHSPILVIDHHATSDNIGDVRLIDNSAAATALIVFDLLKYAGWPITKKIAEALFVAVSTDTGWFQFDNTDSKTLRVCAELIDAGANPSRVYRDLYQNFSQQRFKLMVAMLNTLELHDLATDEHRLTQKIKNKSVKSVKSVANYFATQHLSQTDFKKAGANYSDTENLIDECRRISGVEAAALFVELADGQIKVSLRSWGKFSHRLTQINTENKKYKSVKSVKSVAKISIDVCKIAKKFKGGGHKMAAGAHLPGPIEKAKKLILAEMAEQLEQST